jgi:flagellin
MLSILNNVASTAAQNQMSITNANMQKTLQQLSSGQRINSGADDAAGLSIADGLNANVSALTQSAQNATTGIGELQVADGALAQVTSLLNRAVTLATEASNSGLTADQHTALNNEFTAIKTEIDNIGKTTTYNGSVIFGAGSGGSSTQATDPNTLVSSALTGGSSDTTATGTVLAVKVGGNSVTFTQSADSGSGETMAQFVTDINTQSTANGNGIQASINGSNQLVLTDTKGRSDIVLDATNNTFADAGAVTFANQPINNMNVLQGSGPISAGLKANTSGGTDTLAIDAGGKTYSFSIANNATVAQVISTINSQGTPITASLDPTTGKFALTDTQDNGNISIDAGTTAGLKTALEGAGGAFSNPALMTASNTLSIFLSDSTATGTSTVNVTLNQFDSQNLGVAGQGISNNDLTTTTDAATALTAINAAISSVSSLRGNLGAGVNRLQAATNVISSQTQNLTTAASNITSADVSKTVADMTKFSILSQTGMAAMAQANQMQKGILTLLQG